MLRLCDPGAKPPRKLPQWLLLSDLAAETRFFINALPTAHAVWLNTQNNAWFGSKISIICCELSGAPTPSPRTSHQGLCQCTLLGNFRPLDPLCPHTSKSWLRHWYSGVHRTNGQSANSVQRNRATSRTSCRGTAQRYAVQTDRATSQRSEAARSYGVQRDRVRSRRAEGPRVAMAYRETA